MESLKKIVRASQLWQWMLPFLEPATSLKDKAIRGGFWVAFLRASSWVLWLARIAVLARLLSPYEFGLFGIAFTIVSTAEALSQTGFQAALIQKKVAIEGFLDTAWTVQAIRGLVLALLLIALAPYAALFFNEAELGPLLRVLAFSTVLRGFTSIGILYFQKELEFHRQVVFQLSGVVVDLAIAISIAFLFRNAWALVWGLLGGYLAQMALSYLIHPYRPHIKLNMQQIKELYRFGRWIFVSSLIDALSNMGINAYIARVLGASAVGYYQMARRLAVTPAQEINFVITQVSFPVYVKLQGQWSKLQVAYLQVLRVSAIVAFLLAGTVIFLAANIVSALLGNEWLSIIRPAQILAFWGLAGIIAAPALSLFQAIGKPRLSTLLMLIWLAILTISMYFVGTERGLNGLSLSLAFSAVSISLMALYLRKKVLPGNIIVSGKY